MAGSYGMNIFSFARNCQTVFEGGCTILHFHQHKSFSDSIFLPAFGTFYFSFPDFNKGAVVASHCCFDSQSPNICTTWAIFSYVHLPSVPHLW